VNSQTPRTPTRTEHDSMGTLAVPAEALYGAQTQRAVDNFPISGHGMPPAFIRALVLVKQSAAQANRKLAELPAATSTAIDAACQQVLAMGDDELRVHFPIDVYQTGSGTSSNMNANEVIATLASRAGGEPVHPNDHVNAGQSSNDAIPTALHLSAALELHRQLLPALDHLAQVTRHKSAGVHRHVKTGRTHLMDAMPVRMSQVLQGWAHQVEAGAEQLRSLMPALQQLAQGGTAVGTGVNAHPQFAQAFAAELTALTGLPFRPADSFFAAMGSQDTAVAVSGALKRVAVSLMKIANDLRWMNSGPLAGLAELLNPAKLTGAD
jgi:fumarate hydratase class II